MCDTFEILDHNSEGYIARCKVCRGFTLAFGTTLAVLDQSELDQLHHNVAEHLTSFRNRICPHTKSFLFRFSDDPSCRMVLTYEEMETLNNMLERAHLLCEAQNLIQQTGDA